MGAAYFKSFDASARFESPRECLDMDDTVKKIEDWCREYNEMRPQSTIYNRMPT